MSAHRDRPLHSSESALPEDEAFTGVTWSPGTDATAPSRSEAADDAAEPSSAAPPTWTTPTPTAAPPPHSAEVTTLLPPVPAAGQSPGQPDETRTSWGSAHTGHHRAPAPTAPTSTRNTRAIDALSHVGPRSPVKIPPRRGWRRVVHLLTRVNLGPSPDELHEMELHARIRRNARDSFQIGVLGLKGGAGKTAVTVALGSALSMIRGDRILAVDADPDGGNLGERAGRQSAATVADLLSGRELARYNDIRAYTSMNAANLEVLPAQDYSSAAQQFTDRDWNGVVDIVSRYYNLVLADCGSGLFQPAARGVLATASGLVIVASASVDGSRQAAVAMDWLRQNGYRHLLGRVCVVVNHLVPGRPNLDVGDLVKQFERYVSVGRVIVLPWDPHIASGSEIHLELLSPLFRRRITELAAALSDDFDKGRGSS